MLRQKTARVWFRQVLMLGASLCLAATMPAQKTQSEPATDSAAQASPIQSAPPAHVDDSSQQASPISSTNAHGASVAPHTAIEVRLANGIDSGHLKNGDTVHATLTSTVILSPRGTLSSGAPAELTVVETLPAGRIYAAGEFSLQLLRVGDVSVYTDTLTYRGQPGHKDLPDSAPQVGTDAGLASGAELTFHVLPPPAPANGPPNTKNEGPGSVNGVASGSAPPPGSSKQPGANGKSENASGNKVSGAPGLGKTNSSQARTVDSGNNTPQAAEPEGKSSPAPNQPSSPSNSSSTNSTQPHP